MQDKSVYSAPSIEMETIMLRYALPLFVAPLALGAIAAPLCVVTCGEITAPTNAKTKRSQLRFWSASRGISLYPEVER